jgi:hypothetical protein
MKEDHVAALLRSRAKLVEQRRAMVKRDCASEHNEGFGERIVSIQASIEATDRAIADEQAILAAEMGEAPSVERQSRRPSSPRK